MFKKIVIVLAIIIAGILGTAVSQPDNFSVTRSIEIKAPPEKIFPFVNDFHQWQAWSPWEALDPHMKRTFSGAAQGNGAVYAWSGNSDVGSGRMAIKDATAPGKVVIQLDFVTPFASSNLTEFAFLPEGDKTTVVWTMSGPTPFISKLIGVFISMDRMIGKDFEKGLANLKAVAEK